MARRGAGYGRPRTWGHPRPRPARARPRAGVLNGGMTTPAHPRGRWTPRDPTYRRITLALFLAGVATFALAYARSPCCRCCGGVRITPAAATLSLSTTTVALGLALLVFGPLSDAVGRVRLMQATLLVAALIGIAAAFVDSWEQ